MAKRVKARSITSARTRTARSVGNSDGAIPMAEFADRRARMIKELDDAVALLFAGSVAGHDAFVPHPHFVYATGLMDEPGAVVMLDPKHPVESRRAMLFLSPLNPEVEKWDGYRLEIGAPLRQRTGFATIFRLDKLPMFLAESVKRAKRCACLHPLARIDQPVSPDLEIFRKVQERVPGVEVIDRSEMPVRMRMVKSSAEVGMIRKAVAVTYEGMKEGVKAIRPGASEFDVQTAIEHEYRRQGARRLSFETIAGGGINSTVLHYRANDQPLAAGDVICIDTGARWAGYSGDITRTFPVSGRFNARQAEVYDAVLAANKAAVKAVKPGATIAQIDAVARGVITRAGFGEWFIHGIGHHLGLETHDASLAEPLKVGAVITIEPGVYIPRERIGVRIEDDVVVTRGSGGGRGRGGRGGGCEVISKAIPRERAEVERWVQRG